MKNKFKLLFRFTGTLLLIFLIKNIDINTLVDNLYRINTIQFIILIILTILFLFIKGVRWIILTINFQEKIKYKDNFLLYYAGMFLGMVTPGKIGDLSKVYFLKTINNTSLSKGITITVYERLIDLLVMLSISFLFLIIYILDYSIFISISIFIVLIILFILSFKKVLTILNNYVKSKFNQDLAVPRSNQFLFKVVFLTLLAFITLMLQIFFIMDFLEIDISFFKAGGAMVSANFVSLLPITISGLGTREFSLLFFLSDYKKELIISSSILFFIINNLVNILICFFFWIFQPNKNIKYVKTQ